MLDTSLQLAVIPEDRLRTLIREAVVAALAELRPEVPVDASAEVLDYAGAAEFARLSEATLRRAVKRGELRPAATRCRAVRFNRSELERFLASQGAA